MRSEVYLILYIISSCSFAPPHSVVTSMLIRSLEYSGGGCFPHLMNKYATSISLVIGMINCR